MKPDLPLPFRLVDSCRDKAASVSTSTKRPRRRSTRGIGEILDSDADLVRSVAAISLAGLHAVQAYTFDHAGFLSSLLQILVSFWPLVLIFVGAVLLQRTFGASAGYPASGDH